MNITNQRQVSSCFFLNHAKPPPTPTDQRFFTPPSRHRNWKTSDVASPDRWHRIRVEAKAPSVCWLAKIQRSCVGIPNHPMLYASNICNAHQLIARLSHYLQALYIPGGAGFLPSTVAVVLFWKSISMILRVPLWFGPQGMGRGTYEPRTRKDKHFIRWDSLHQISNISRWQLYSASIYIYNYKYINIFL